MSISISDLSSTSHEILQVLPADPAGQILHNDPVVSPGRRSIFIQPDGSPTIPPVSPPIPVPRPTPVPPGTPPRAPPILVPAMGSTPCKFHRHPLPHELSSMQIIHSVISIPIVIKLQKSISDKLIDKQKVNTQYFTNPFLMDISLSLPYFRKNLSISFSLAR